VPDTEGREPSEAQQAIRDRFRQAAVYGKMVMADPETKAIYENAAAAKGKPLFSLMIADFFNAPSVDEVDVSGYSGKAGDTIRIRAHDDFDVTGVNVAISPTSTHKFIFAHFLIIRTLKSFASIERSLKMPCSEDLPS
jgi:hypothetical protein